MNLPHSMDQVAQLIGYVVMTGGGGILAMAFFGFVWWITWLIFKEQAASVCKVYRVEVVKYWLTRLEQYGWRDFREAEKQDKTKKETTGIGPYTYEK